MIALKTELGSSADSTEFKASRFDVRPILTPNSLIPIIIEKIDKVKRNIFFFPYPLGSRLQELAVIDSRHDMMDIKDKTGRSVGLTTQEELQESVVEAMLKGGLDQTKSPEVLTYEKDGSR